jgi:hypothetical protein
MKPESDGENWFENQNMNKFRLEPNLECEIQTGSVIKVRVIWTSWESETLTSFYFGTTTGSETKVQTSLETETWASVTGLILKLD